MTTRYPEQQQRSALMFDVDESQTVINKDLTGSLIDPNIARGYGVLQQTLRVFLLVLYLSASVVVISVTQLIGAPLYFYSVAAYYSWMAMTKKHFGVVLITMTYWWTPVKVIVSGDASVRGQFRIADGRLECDFPERIVLISNHQIYTDWIYLWWIGYTASMHGHLFIILKESIKYVPLVGSAMKFFSFILLSRRWSIDKMRFKHRLEKLRTGYNRSCSISLTPMWLLIFPEGTNVSKNGRAASHRWADKQGIEDMKHCLLPRSTGLAFCLTELEDSLEYLYDCTLAYGGIPPGHYGQDVLSLRGVYLQGRLPTSVNMHWRRFRISDIPTHDEDSFEKWLLARWREKDELLQHYQVHGRFTVDTDGKEPLVEPIETEVRPAVWFEWGQIFVPCALTTLLVNAVLGITSL